MKKFFLLLLFILGGFGLFVSNSSHRNSTIVSGITPTQFQKAPSVSKSIPAPRTNPQLATKQIAAVQGFYDWYTTCSHTGRNCDFSTQPYADAAKIKSLAANARGYNAIVCAQNLPQSIRAERSTDPDGGHATVYVVESFGGNTQRQLLVDVQEENGNWKIINITCPRP